MSGPYFCFMTTYVNSHVCEPALKYIKWYFCHRLKVYIVVFIFFDLLLFCVFYVLS